MRFHALFRLLSPVRLALLSGLAALALPAAEETAPPSMWRGGFDLRLRNEYFDNALTLDDSAARHEQNYQRYRARAWGSVDLMPSLALNGRLAWESWDWNHPSYKAPYPKGWVWSEGIIDQLNLTWKSAGDIPATVVLGRQDIVLGDGWLVFDATPTDGSRTAYFDAARVTVSLPERKTTVDFAYFDLDPNHEHRLHALNDRGSLVAEQAERGAYLQISNKALDALTLEGYAIYRDQTRRAANGDDGQLLTFGGRAVYEPTPHWQLKGEAALQAGDVNDRDVRSWGLLGQLAWNAKDSLNNQLRFTLECLSGDDPNTSDNEQFDMVWGRYPRWSELYALLFVPETRVAQYGNLVRLGPGWSCSPVKPLSLSLDYNALWAMENNRSTASGFFASDGNFRGHLVRGVAKYKINSHMTATTLVEMLEPGDYYGPSKQDTAFFWRLELAIAY